MSDSNAQEPQPEERGGWRRSRWFILAMGIAILVVAIVVLMAPVAATSSSSYCGSCHSMKVAYSTWKHGQHSGVACSQCHVPSGVMASIKWRTKEARNIWLEYLNMRPRADKEPVPASEACIKCHPLKGLMGVPGKIRMPHAKHINQNNLECVDCHDNTAHAKPGESNAVSMSPCTMCHEQTTDPNRCDFCHYTPPTQGEAHPTDYIQEHGALATANEQDCLRCHHNRAAFCDACHAKPTPGHYSGTWPYDHGQEAKKDRARCLGCHTEKQLCNQCHTVDHPADWVTSHAPVATKGDRSCMVCHPRQMCVDCHAAEGVTVQ